MYSKGDLRVKDGKSDEDLRCAWDIPDGAVFLEHSCDEWVIGSQEAVRDLIEDLKDYLAGTYMNKLSK